MKFVDSYYKLKALYHALKNGDYQAIEISAYLLSKYISKDDIHYFDNNGQSSDEDMEYQINHLGLESIIKNVINKLIL